jgi:outer membrane protein OmpA-like peptidoglycan-associated protein
VAHFSGGILLVRFRFLAGGAALVAAASLFTRPALAQNTASGFALDRFNPSERGSEWFSLDSLDFRGQVRPAIGLVGELAVNPLVVYNADGSTRAIPVQDQLILHPGASLVLWERVRLGLDLPIAVYQNGNSGSVMGETYAGVGKAGVGDLRIGADVRILGQYGDAFRLSLGAQVWVPFGDRSGYLSDGQVRVLPRVQGAGDVGPFCYAANVGFDYHSLAETFGGTGLGSQFAWGLAVGVHALDHNFIAGPELYGSTVVTNGSAFSTGNTPVELLLGAHYLAASALRFGLGVGPGLTKGLGEPAARVVASLEWVPQPATEPAKPSDKDGDGIADADDACPEDPGVKTDDPNTNGCPPPPPDRDKDGIPDAKDACVDVPGVKTDDQKTNGCPPDKDQDGIPDAQDACPDVPGVKTDDPKTNGCPPDRDKDGILDAQDACPDVPGVKTDDPKTNGCPPDPDRDKDGIPNEQDACPDAPGKPNKDPKKNGCPEAAIVGKSIFILEQVKFATGSAKILPASDKLLGAVLKILVDHPDIKHVSIEGHTDNHGSAEMNKELSARRAASVVSWLVQHGIGTDRLSSAGFGLERPIDTNDTAEGRQNNRRVEFHIQEDADNQTK